MHFFPPGPRGPGGPRGPPAGPRFWAPFWTPKMTLFAHFGPLSDPIWHFSGSARPRGASSRQNSRGGGSPSAPPTRPKVFNNFCARLRRPETGVKTASVLPPVLAASELRTRSGRDVRIRGDSLSGRVDLAIGGPPKECGVRQRAEIRSLADAASATHSTELDAASGSFETLCGRVSWRCVAAPYPDQCLLRRT